ncbi:MAG: HNH endonuclease [bacterium]
MSHDTDEGFLEFHHVVPYARGGRSTVDNIELRCRTHNAYEAERLFGRSGTAGGTRGVRPRRPSGRRCCGSGRSIKQLVPERVRRRARP